MVYNLCFFNEGSSKEEVAVNPFLVRIVMQWDAKSVMIIFDRDHSVTVEGTVQSVSKKLREAIQ